MVQTTLKRSGMDHTPFNLQRTPCLPLPRKRSPDGASTECGGEHLIAAHYSFIDPERMKGWVGKVKLCYWLLFLLSTITSEIKIVITITLDIIYNSWYFNNIQHRHTNLTHTCYLHINTYTFARDYCISAIVVSQLFTEYLQRKTMNCIWC